MSNADSLNKYTILLVDDESKTLKYFHKAFDNDFQTLTCQSAAEALHMLERQHNEIAILITDQCMPAQKGVDLLTIVSQRYPNIIRMITTAYSSLDDAIRAVNEGAVFRYIPKPWNLAAFRTDLKEGIKLFLIRKKEFDLLEERKETMLTLAGVVAHEMRTPLLTISTAAQGIRDYLPALLTVYHDALQRGKLENGQPVPIIRNGHLNILENIGQDIQEVTVHANIFIDTLLKNAGQQHPDSSAFSTCSMLECIEKAVSQYPLNDTERAKTTIDRSVDFQFYGSNILFTYVIFNLLKNALYALAAATKGEIMIRLECQKDKNRLFFKDTGTGIPKNILSRIFDDFFSSKRTGSNIGIGLGYCRQTVESFSGTIACHSEEGTYTEFVITLPPEK